MKRKDFGVDDGGTWIKKIRPFHPRPRARLVLLAFELRKIKSKKESSSRSFLHGEGRTFREISAYAGKCGPCEITGRETDAT